MDFGLLASLAGLALIDSTSFGTFGIPLVMVVATRRVNGRALGWYFGTVSLFYFLVGVLLLLGLDAVFDVLADAVDSDVGSVIQLAVGIAMLVLSFRIGNDKEKATKPKRNWVPSSDRPATMVGLGLTAAMLEVATMLPYLSAIGLLTTSDLRSAAQIGILALYCVVMILPALVVIGAAALFGDRLWVRLERLNAWIQKNATETVAWIVGIAGFLIARDAVWRLGLLG